MDEYLDALIKEIDLTFAQVPPRSIQTIYIGGGTPTALSEKQLQVLLEALHSLVSLESHYEFTMEANPGDLTKEKLAILREYGVNRLSIGVQSFNDRLLERIGRKHRVNDVYQSIAMAREEGFTNMSIDLMYALPGQTMNDVVHSLQEFFRLGIEHCSAYSLIVEPKTIFYNLLQRGKLRLPSQDLDADMYELIMNEMNEHGYNQYEISNYARPGYESKHNLVYWNNDEYYGFGAGAHAYLNKTRRANINPVRKYIQTLAANQLPINSEIALTEKDIMEEEMILGLRKNEGVSIARFIDKFAIDPLKLYQTQIDKLEKNGLIKVVDGFIRLTHRGRMLGNNVFMEFIGN